jgi:hypothetical protein
MVAARRLPWWLPLCGPALACATGGPARKVDLVPVRAAVEEARQAGAPDRASQSFARAEAHLKEAEAALLRGGAAGSAEAGRLADLALVEAHCAAGLARAALDQAKARVPAAEAERLTTRLRRADEEHRRLEDRVNLLLRELELTETELIRSKARLKGNETKAEASAAIAEARTLARRLEQDKGRASTLARCREALAKAEDQLLAGNFGAAIFFAMKAQDTVTKSGDAPVAAESVASDGPATQSSFRARAAVNVRKGPAADEPVVAKAPSGASLAALATRGDWVKVSYRGVIGWVRRDLLR